MAFALLLAAASHASADAGGENSSCVVSEPDHYRMRAFRAPTPCTLAGATVLDSESLAALMASAMPLLIDVMPAQRRPANLASDALWLPAQRRNIPGSIWLPNVGFGLLPVEEDRYFRDNLQRLHAAGRAMVFYCESECWMSWNAARRALEWGYGNVHWYPGGTDAWQATGRDLVDSSPVSREEHQ